MSEFKSTKRTKTTQNLPVITNPSRRAGDRQWYFASSFVTQVIVEYERTGRQEDAAAAPHNPALNAYRAGANVTNKRLPAGAGHADVA